VYKNYTKHSLKAMQKTAKAVSLISLPPFCFYPASNEVSDQRGLRMIPAKM